MSFILTHMIGFGSKRSSTTPSVLTPSGYIGNATARGGLAAAFDGNTNQASTATATVLSSNIIWVGADWGAAKTLTQMVIYSSNDYGFQESNNPSGMTARIYGSNTTPASETDGTQLDSWTVNDTNALMTETRNSTITQTTAYRYHWFYLTYSFQGQHMHVGEIVCTGY